MADFSCGYVAVVGRPNVGKSTLVNRLLEYPLSIVSRKPQTTRQKVLGVLTGDAYQVILLDSPGLMVPRYALQELMVRAAWSAIQEADVVLQLTEPHEDDLDAETGILRRLRELKKPVILAINKIDLVKKSELLGLIEFFSRVYPFEEIVPISALKNDGIDVLKGLVVARLPHRPPFYPPGEITDRPQRFFVGEVVRQKVFELFGEEVPYSVAVVVDEYKEREVGKDYIRATVVCDKPSQKGILIGKGGDAIRRLGKSARAEIETLIGKEVFLELKVEVRENWRRQERSIKDLGQV